MLHYAVASESVKVVDLPQPVGPVTKTMPLGSANQERADPRLRLLVQAQALEGSDLIGKSLGVPSRNQGYSTPSL
jgi:hypothetical protein